MKVTIVEKRVGKEPKVTEIENSLEAIQEFVGGYYEVITIDTPKGKVYMHCNEEGIYSQLPKNFAFINIGGIILGDVFFAEADEEGELVSIRKECIDIIMSSFTEKGKMLKI